VAAHEGVVSTFDELNARFGVGKKLVAAIERRFGQSADTMLFSVRWWPRRDAPTSAFAGVYRHSPARVQTFAMGVAPPAATVPLLAGSSMPDVEAWFIITRGIVEEPPTTTLLSRAIEFMSPIPHSAVMSVVDAYDFFQLGRAQRERPSSLATHFAEVWHAPKLVDGRLVFFAFSDMRFRRVSIDLDTARVDDTPL
jgi:hypothetical protein